MNYLDSVFGYYDKLIANLSPMQQAAISLILLALLVWQIYMIIKSGHWIFIAALIVLAPGTWPAAKKVASFVWILIKFLMTRTQIIFN